MIFQTNIPIKAKYNNKRIKDLILPKEYFENIINNKIKTTTNNNIAITSMLKAE